MLGAIINNALTIGVILTLLGGAFTAIGTYHSSKVQKDLNIKIEEGINKQNEKDRPIIDITNGSISGQTVNIKITNSGERLAEEVVLHFKKHPNKFVESMSISLKKVPANGTVATISFDIWQHQFGQYMTGKLKDDWEKFQSDFKEGKKALVIIFYITYEYENSEYKTNDYALLYDGKSIFNISSLN